MDHIFILPGRNPEAYDAWLDMVVDILELIWSGVGRIVVYTPNVREDTEMILGMTCRMSPEEFEAARRDPHQILKLMKVALMLQEQVKVFPVGQAPKGLCDDQAVN